jgi:hypothetical protein
LDERQEVIGQRPPVVEDDGDDVQGMAGIVLAGMINAPRLKGTQLKDESYLFLGAGSAAIGLADLLCSALVQQGMALEDAQARVHMFEINGLLEPSRKDLYDFQKPYAHPNAPGRDFVACIGKRLSGKEASCPVRRCLRRALASLLLVFKRAALSPLISAFNSWRAFPRSAHAIRCAILELADPISISLGSALSQSNCVAHEI